MPTVIDSLIVELGIDPAGISKGGKEAGEAFLKTRDQASKVGKEIESSAKGATQFLSQLRRQVIELFAAFTAGKGLEKFVRDVATTDAEVGRLSYTMDESIGVLSAWRNVSVLVGGTVSGISASMQGLVAAFQDFSLTGESSVLPYFRALGISISDNRGKMRDVGAILLDLADRFQHLDPARAAAFGRALGFDQGTINLLIQGRAAVQAMLDEQKRLGTITKEDAAAGIALQRAWAEMEIASTSLGRTLLTIVAPVLVRILNALRDLAVWARAHKPFIEALFTGLAIAATAFGAALLAPVAGVIAMTAAVVAAIAVVALLYDDWVTWTKGGKSAFADFWAAVEPTLNDLGRVAHDVVTAITVLFTGSGDQIRASWSKLFKDLGQLFWDFVKGALPTIVLGLENAFGRAFIWLEGRINAIWDAIFHHPLFTEDKSLGPSSAPKSSRAPSSASRSQRAAQAWDAAQAAQARYGIPAQVTYAQWALESNYGASTPAGSNNPFGIKAIAGQPYVDATTTEYVNGVARRVTQRFAKYATLSDAFAAHARLLASAKQYAGARTHEDDANAFADALTGVYATDPNYGAKLRSIMNSRSAARIADNSRRSTSSVHHETKIDTVVVQTRATDAKGIARDIKPAIENNAFATQANYSAV